jgi:hypothetical protein
VGPSGANRQPTADELAHWLSEASGAAGERHLVAANRWVVERRPDSLPWLRDLLRDRRRDVRLWAADTGSQVYGREFVTHLLTRLSDGSLEVRANVLAKVRKLDPEALRSRLPRIRTWLRRRVDHPMDYKAILMTLAALRDVESIPDIEAFVQEMGVARKWPYYVRLGRSVGADREMMELLERASRTDPDEQCRAYFAEAVSAIGAGGAN